MKLVKTLFNINTIGTLLLVATVVSIIVLFAFYGNGQYTANIVIR